MDAQAFLIMFRETLEALLIVGIINTFLKQLGRADFTKWVWVGVAGAVFSSLLVALLFQVVLTGFAAMGSQQYMKITIMLISSVLLTQMILWMSDNSKGISGKTKEKIGHLVTAGSAIGMVIHAYLVVLREGVETVFFFMAVSKGDISQAIQSWGALLGLVAAALLSYLMFKRMVKFPIAVFFKATGFLIMMIAAGLLVQAIGLMQDLKIMGSVMPEAYNIAWFMPEHPIDGEQLIRDTGIHPLISGNVGIFFATMFGYSHNPSVEQVVAYIGYYVVLFAWVRFRRRRKEGEVNDKAQPSSTYNQANGQKMVRDQLAAK
jgi:high-affinity iron transporter